jgi:hypothetical protein
MTRFLTLTEMKAGQAVLASNTDSERVRLTLSSPEGVTLREEAIVVRPPVPAPPLPEPEKPAPKAKGPAKSAKAVRGRSQTD